MNRFRVIALRLVGLLSRRRRDRDLDDEVQAHLELLAEEFVRNGMSQPDARAAARREFGGVDQVKEIYRDQRGLPFLDTLSQDVRYALRQLRRNRGFAAVAILTFALGIGANTAIFTLIDGLLLRWLPVRDPQQIVQLTIVRPDAPRPGQSLSYPLVRALSAQTPALFSGLFGFSNTTFLVGSRDAPERVRGAWVTGAYYETLGLKPASGRLLTPGDDRLGANPAAVITDGYWERRFARDPRISGTTMLVEGVPVTIVGVTRPPFTGVDVGDSADITLAIGVVPQILPTQASLLDADTTWLQVFARPRDGVSRSQAKAGLAVVWPRVVDEVVRASDEGTRRRVVGTTLNLIDGGTGWTLLRQQFLQPLFVLMALVGLVLLIACANVANLLLARAMARRREIAIRLAIGAGRARIVRQMLTESILLSLAGAAAGLSLAWFIERFLISLLSSARRTPIMLELTPHWHVLAYTTATAVITGVLFGLAPALRASTAGSAAALTTGSKVIGESRGRLAPSLVVAEVALSLLMLVGAGLFVGTLQNLRHRDVGFRHDGILLADIDGAQTGRDGPQLTAFYAELLREAERVPGVRSASLSLITPLAGGGISSPNLVARNGQPLGGETYFNGVGPRYFVTLKTPVVAGREFSESDAGSAPHVAVANETFIKRHFSGVAALGQHVSIFGDDVQIVGVVKDAVYESLRDAPPPTVYMPIAQARSDPSRPVTLAIDAGDSSSPLSLTFERLLQPKFPGVPVRVRTFSGQIERALIRERLMATLAGGFGVLALVLASVGLYGLLAYTVARRTNEIGVRMALGAGRARVVQLVMSDACRLVGLGTALGLLAAPLTSRLVASMLFGLAPTDPATLVAAAAVLGVSGLIASFLPAYRAARVDPMVALRQE